MKQGHKHHIPFEKQHGKHATQNYEHRHPFLDFPISLHSKQNKARSQSLSSAGHNKAPLEEVAESYPKDPNQ